MIEMRELSELNGIRFEFESLQFKSKLFDNFEFTKLFEFVKQSYNRPVYLNNRERQQIKLTSKKYRWHINFFILLTFTNIAFQLGFHQIYKKLIIKRFNPPRIS